MIKERNYLGFVSENYSLEILRPIQAEIKQRGGKFFWFVYGNHFNKNLFSDNEEVIKDVNELFTLNIAATIVPGNIVPSFFPGIKVQVFHGFEWKKKGHFKIRGFFDLYCTQGPFFTAKFEKLALKHKYFKVIETGWPKLDQYKFATKVITHKPGVILYAPTFSPSFSSLKNLFETIVELSHESDWLWVVKLHPKTEPIWFDKFSSVAHSKLIIGQDMNMADLMVSADLLLSDTSSVVTEFALLSKPVVTFNNANPEGYYTNISHEGDLKNVLEVKLMQNNLSNQNRVAAELHPYTDFKSAQRVIEAIELVINSGVKTKPLNLFRSLKIRHKLKFWKI